MINNCNKVKKFNSDNEPIFWKVIHNVYLLKLILERVEVVGINRSSQIKFKHLTSMELMLKMKQYQLLICKLKANEYIDLSKSSFQKLFRLNNNNNEDEIKEIFNLLYEKKKLELLQFDLLSIALEIEDLNNKKRVENYDAVEILLNEPFSIKIFPSVLEWVILNCSYQMVDILVNSHNLIITEELKNRSISLAFTRNNNNDNHKELIIGLLLNKFYNNNNNNNNNNNDNNNDFNNFQSIKKIPDINKFLFIKDSKIINQLLNLNYFNNSNHDEIKEIIKNDKSENKIKEVFKILVKKDKNNYKNYLLKYFEPIEDLDIEYLEIVIQFSFLNFEPKTFKWVISKTVTSDKDKKASFNFLTVKLIIESISLDNKKNNIKRELESTYEFIEYYTKQSECLAFRNIDVDQEIKQLLLSSKTSEEYERVYNSISPNSKINSIPISLYPKCWNQVLIDLSNWGFNYSKIYINNKEKFDWILENCNGFLLKEKLRSFTTRELFQFESLELIQYAIDAFSDKSSILYYPKSLNGDSYFYKCLLYHQTYINAINNYDIETLKFIDENVLGFKLENDMIFSSNQNSDENYSYYKIYKREFKDSFNNLNETTTIENQEKLINYLNDSGYKAFNEKTFEKFLFDFKFNSDKIKIKFNDQFQQYSKKFDELSPLLMTKLVNGFSNDFQMILLPSLSKLDLDSLFTNNSILSYIYEDYYYETGEMNDNDYYQVYVPTTCQNPKHVIECIETLIKSFKITSTTTTTTTSKDNQILEKLINRLFRCLIKIDDVKFKDVEKIRRLILDNSISLEHSLFHSFYYLGLKSQEFIQYLIKLPFIGKLLKSKNIPNYNSEKIYDHNGYDIGKYLKSNIFTWEFIFGNNSNSLNEFAQPPPFSIVLERLIHEVSHLPYFNDKMVIHENNYLFKTFNYNLEYLLEIKRVDLFFNELNYIQKLLKDKTVPLVSFSKLLKIPDEIQEDINNNNNNNNTKNNYFKRDVYNELIKDDGYFIYFPISPFIFKTLLFLMDTHTFSVFVKSYSYLSFIDYLSKTKNFKYSEISSKSVLDLILDHSQLIDQIINNQIINTQNDDNLKNFWYKVFNINISENTIIKYSNFFFGNNNHSELMDLILEKLNKSGKFNIPLRELVLNNFPNHYYFQIDDELLNQAYKTSNFNFVNYLYDFGYLNQDNIQFLKLKLSQKLNSKENHHPFRFISWLL
ncbi:hypothetical protein DDB_G0289603 [Dictyostelium discoideum AX4]|uniref:Uncharacterized protein n=1 Tax=Dictyostelium discoideum TaxID=44689 RepID=Q54HA0_DICDI|nr:hypothetical protein DDB_G0289603 [Dictyostelium discoideum AX4]EAL62619.1 hypothetical protein DDB_G0289603 [Dictyostelium discoideum AX4]|eukprot:XP_636124.1 hypothetical protein DDB_G0289603 [Dictyostelium discoideum AX4]